MNKLLKLSERAEMLIALKQRMHREEQRAHERDRLGVPRRDRYACHASVLHIRKAQRI